MFLRVGHLLGAAHVPVAHGRDDCEVGGDGGCGDVEADLVVAFARRAVSDVRRPHLARSLDEFFRYERACERREERVLPAVEGVGLYGGRDVRSSELGLRVADEGVGRAYVEGLVLHVVRGLSLAEVEVERVRRRPRCSSHFRQTEVSSPPE